MILFYFLATGVDQIPALHYYMHFVFYASVLSNLLPPVEYFSAFPRFQKGYTVFVTIVHHYAALNFRGKIAGAYNRRQNGDGGADLRDSPSENKMKGVPPGKGL
jgi:hypothetical protein